MLRVLVPLIVAMLAAAPPPASAAKRLPTDHDAARDKGCGKGWDAITHRRGTLRGLAGPPSGGSTIAVCDTRFGRTINLPVTGTRRNDEVLEVLARAGTRTIVRGYRDHPRGPSNDPFESRYVVDLRSGVRLPISEFGTQAVLRKTGRAYYVDARGTLLTFAPDGRRDALGHSPVSSSPLTFRGSVATFGRPSRRVSVEVTAQLRRLTTCAPGREGSAPVRGLVDVSERDDMRIWTDRAGVTRACPRQPTGELRLPCGAVTPGRPADPRLARFAAAGNRLAVHCAGAPDTVAVIDPAARTVLATHALGATGLSAALAVSESGAVVFTGRRDGGAGPKANVLFAVGPDGQAPRVLGEAGDEIRNVRFTTPSTLAWAEIERPGGPPQGRTATL